MAKHRGRNVFMSQTIPDYRILDDREDRARLIMEDTDNTLNLNRDLMVIKATQPKYAYKAKRHKYVHNSHHFK